MTLLDKIRDDYQKKLEAEWMPSGEKIVKPLRMNTGMQFSTADIEKMKASMRNTFGQTTEVLVAFANTK